jgi:SAM-dependent methyltransferase
MTAFDNKDFWRDPSKYNLHNAKLQYWLTPGFWLRRETTTELVVLKLVKYLNLTDSIMELGSGTGRNLAGLKMAGFTNLHGVEINPDAVKLGYEYFDLDGIDVQAVAIEDAVIPQVDCILTVGVLMHIPPSAEWVFDVMAKQAGKLLMTVDNEVKQRDFVPYSWKRNYQEVFESRGWKQVEEMNCGTVKHLTDESIMRIFTK